MEVDRRRPFNSLEEQPSAHPPPNYFPPPLYKASVSELAGGGAASANSSAAGDEVIISRIRKCLYRVTDKNITESKAKATFFMAWRLMDQFNVSQAEVLAHVSPETRRQYAGHSTVKIHRLDEDDKPVRQQGHVRNLGHAMSIFFDCKFCTIKNHSSLNVVFYGIAENTVAAAVAFERAYNQITDWARHYKSVGSINSYCHGVADGLLSSAGSQNRCGGSDLPTSCSPRES